MPDQTRDNPGRDNIEGAAVGIRALRADLTKFVKEAGAGRSFRILVSGKAKAALVPLTQARETTVSLDQLIASGLILAPLDPRAVDPTTIPRLPLLFDSGSLVQRVR